MPSHPKQRRSRRAAPARERVACSLQCSSWFLLGLSRAGEDVAEKGMEILLAGELGKAERA